MPTSAHEKKRKVPGFSSGDYADATDRLPDYVIVELKFQSRVAFAPGAAAFGGPADVEGDVSSINSVLEKFDVKDVRPHFPQLKKKDFDMRVAAAPALGAGPVDSMFALAGFVEVVPKRDQDCPKIVDQLNRHPAVWKAVIAPRPEPAAKVKTKPKPKPPAVAVKTPNFEPAQGYLHDPPDGIGAIAVWPLKAAGAGITVCDIEGNWNLTHEDLPVGIKLIGGEPIPDVGWTNHGTAVLGEMVSVPKSVGTVGICHKAKAVVQSAIINGVFNAAGAITNAASKLGPGDVILIELHAKGGPDNKYLAMQYWDAVFAAIKTAVGMGIVVVEAGGNGDEDFDRPEYAGTGLQKDAGAVVVGAGVPPSNYFAAFDGPIYGFPEHDRLGKPRSRIWFSNHGAIVNVQGWGWHVMTLGYGDAQNLSDPNRWYTLRFSGTSSASPIVTGAVACIQSYARAKTGSPLTPTQVRDILVKTGTHQEDDAPRAPIGQHIGPLPNLPKALEEVDRIIA